MLTTKCNGAQTLFLLTLKAIIEPEKVIAPTPAPIDISIRPANFISPASD